MALTFLLGSGISIDAEMPSVETLGKRIFDGAGVGRVSGAFVTSPAGSIDFEAGADTAAFLRRLRDLSAEYFHEYLGGVAVSYEDVANVALQVRDALSGEYESAGLLPLLRTLAADVGGNDALGTAAGRACDYVTDIVCEGVGREPASAEHLGAILDACEALDDVEIYDLNHDRVLETALGKRGVNFADGFGTSDGDLAFWEDRFDMPIRLHKLHGSVRWFRHNKPGFSFAPTTRCTNGDPDHAQDGMGNSFGFAVDSRAQILTGTFGKTLRYEGAAFRDIHLRMQNRIRACQAVVVIGYGFRDKTINTRLIHWMLQSREHRLVVVHPDLDQLLKHARGAVAREWARWIESQQLSVISKPIDKTTWPDVAFSVQPGSADELGRPRRG